MDKSINNLLSKLKVLSKIQSGQKLVINDSNMIIYECDKKNWDRFIKWWLGETRAKTIDKLKGFYCEVRDLVSDLLSDVEKNKISLIRLHSELNGGIRGINNLILTYQKDRTIVSQLEILYENFFIEINRLVDVLKDIDEPEENILTGRKLELI